MADAALTRRDSRRPSALMAPEASGVLTRAEYRRLAAAACAEPVIAATVIDAPTLVEALSVSAVVDTVAAAAADADEPGSDALPATDLPADSAFSASAEPECLVDEFEFSARLFSFTGETPIQAPHIAHEEASPVPVASAVIHLAPRKPRFGAGAVAQRLAAASFSIGVMTIVGMLAVGTTTPAAAVASVSAQGADLTVARSAATKVAPEEIQAFVATSSAGAASLDRTESYDVASMADVAADSGVTLFAGTWVNDPEAPIQWPFPVGVPVSAAFGSSSYLSQFASPHRGVDLTPGAGAEVQAVAAGTVRIATEAGGDYGVTVLIDHIINGQPVSTRYAHMQYGSLQVAPGDTVAAGDVLGKVGQTGKVTGPHLHLEVLLGGTTKIDPMAWLSERMAGPTTVG